MGDLQDFERDIIEAVARLECEYQRQAPTKSDLDAFYVDDGEIEREITEYEAQCLNACREGLKHIGRPEWAEELADRICDCEEARPDRDLMDIHKSEAQSLRAWANNAPASCPAIFRLVIEHRARMFEASAKELRSECKPVTKYDPDRRRVAITLDDALMDKGVAAADCVAVGLLTCAELWPEDFPAKGSLGSLKEAQNFYQYCEGWRQNLRNWRKDQKQERKGGKQDKTPHK